MKSRWKRVIVAVAGMMLVCLSSSAPVNGQTRPSHKEPMAEDVFKDVQVLKGISVDEFMDTMGFFSASLTLNCTNCHGEASAGNRARYADETPLKQTARKMILMVTALNKNNFGGARAVTCYTCHRGDENPETTPSLAAQYAVPLPDDPDLVEVRKQDPEEPSADQIFDKYIQALGGPQQVAKLTTFAAKGTYDGYDTEHLPVPLEVFVKAPNQRATIAHTPRGDAATIYDGSAGWTSLPDSVVPLTTLTGGNLDGVKMDAILSFPLEAKQARTQWRVGGTRIDDRDVEVVEGTGAGQSPIKLYFDKESGLLLRLVRYSNTIVGRVPAQVDYSDYREVSGVKMPFKWIDTWTDGQTIIELTDIEPNVPIDAAKFAKPPVPSPPKP